MPEKKDQQYSTHADIKKRLELGSSKALLVFPTQPIQVIIRYQQHALISNEHSKPLSFIESYRVIKKDNNLKSFFKGAGPAASKEFLKNFVYKAYFLENAPSLADNVLTSNPLITTTLTTQQYQVSKVVLAGFIAGSSDVLFGGALEAWATFSATSQGKNAKADFLKEAQSQKNLIGKLGSIYRGWFPSVLKGSFAFSTYFAADRHVTLAVDRLYGLKPSERKPWYVKFSEAIAVGGCVAIVSSPWDIIKTGFQSPNAHETVLKNKNVFQALTYNIKKHGSRGLTTGIPGKFLMITAGWGVNKLILQRNNPSPSNNSSEQKDASTQLRR